MDNFVSAALAVGTRLFAIATRVYDNRSSWGLGARRTDAAKPSRFGRRTHSYVDAEIAAAKAAEKGGDPLAGFRRLERAHVLGQNSTFQHVRVHLHMLGWATRHHDAREFIGQVLRVIGAAAGTWVGLVPQGNTGGSNVSGFKSMKIPDDLAEQIASVARVSVPEVCELP